MPPFPVPADRKATSPVSQELTDPLKDALPERLEIVRGDFSVIGKMSRLKKLAISAMTVKVLSFLVLQQAEQIWQPQPDILQASAVPTGLIE